MGELIREHASEAEQQRSLSRPVVEALINAGAFRATAPRSLGGLELDPITFYRAVETLAAMDGSVGWCVFPSGGGCVETQFLPDAAAERIWSDPRAVIAGGLFPFGSARAVEGGYRVSGRWPYASNSALPPEAGVGAFVLAFVMPTLAPVARTTDHRAPISGSAKPRRLRRRPPRTTVQLGHPLPQMAGSRPHL